MSDQEERSPNEKGASNPVADAQILHQTSDTTCNVDREESDEVGQHTVRNPRAVLVPYPHTSPDSSCRHTDRFAIPGVFLISKYRITTDNKSTRPITTDNNIARPITLATPGVFLISRHRMSTDSSIARPITLATPGAFRFA